MTEIIPVILIATDETLRQLVHEHVKVFAKFTSDNCPTCELLAPPFERLAVEPDNAGIQFVRLDSDENPVAKLLMAQKVAPFFVSYCQGRLLECDLLTTEVDMEAQLKRLRQHQPLS